jgi:hypothetical protein
MATLFVPLVDKFLLEYLALDFLLLNVVLHLLCDALLDDPLVLNLLHLF